MRRVLASLMLMFVSAGLVAQQYTLTGGLTGTLNSWYLAKGTVPYGDTNFCTQTAPTFASGASAGTNTYDLGDGDGSHTLTGQIICTQNDGTSPISTTAISIGIYKITNLDMGNNSNDAITGVNVMSDFGAFDIAGNTPAGWYSMCTTGVMTTSACDWKSNKPMAINGWVVLPIFRQDHTGYWGHDVTLIASPDGGAHWCNPYNLLRTGTPNSAGCISRGSANGDAPLCTASSVTTTITGNLNTITTAVPVADAANITINTNIRIDGTGGTLEMVYVTACSGGCGVAGASTLTVVRSPIGGRNHTSGATVQIPQACADAGYTDGTHSSMMFKDTTPYNGTAGISEIQFFDYCQNNSCTGMPDDADTYVYGFASNGNQSRNYLFRVLKDITKIMDPAYWEWYNHTGYSPTDTGDGTEWTSTAPGVQVFAGRSYSSGPAAGFGATQVNLLGTVNTPIYLCAGSSCSYIASVFVQLATGTSGIFPEGIISFPHPWGPYSKPQGLHSSYPDGPWGFFNVMRLYAKQTDPTGYNVQAIAMGNTGVPATGSPAWQAYNLAIAPAQGGNAQSGSSGIRFSTGSSKGTIPRTGLYAYFDCFDNRLYDVAGGVGSLYAPFIYCTDISKVTPTLVLSSTDSAGAVQNSVTSGMVWVSTGPSQTRSTQRRFELRSNDQTNSLSTATPFSGDASWTISMLVDVTTAFTTSQGLFQVGTGAHSSIFAEINSAIGHILFDVNGATSGGYVNTTTGYGGLVVNEWHHLVFTKAAGALSTTTAKIYVDGVSKPLTLGSAQVGSTNVTANTLQVMYGNQNGSGGTSGRLGGFGIWSRVLSAAEVKNTYDTLKAISVSRGITLP